MNFLGLGPGELVLVAVLGLIVFGPGRLPEIAAQIGRTLRDLRQSSADIRSEFQRSFTLELDPPDRAAAAVEEPAAEEPVPAVASDAPTERLEPAPADTAEWRWESSQSAERGAPTLPQGEPAPADVVFWEWDGSSGSSILARPAALPATIEWQWDDGLALSNGRDGNGHQPAEEAPLAAGVEPAIPTVDSEPSAAPAATSPPSA